jgi:D-arabinose 1-dehydrogenase-like Zn-dependent alcohol dehydrogenase
MSSTQLTPIDVLCMACADKSCDFKPMRLQRRPLGEYDVQIEMKYCGICHTDLHAAAGHLGAIGMSSYPCVPGHELSGVCTAVGSAVTKVSFFYFYFYFYFL